jgi:Na+/H+ antiporter family
VTGSILNGSIAGNHLSPISDTTIVSSLSSDCAVMRHVVTRTPYFIIIIMIALAVGTLPAGYEIWPNYVSILLGMIMVALFVYVLCVPILDSCGRYDMITELCFRFTNKDLKLEELRDDTIVFYSVQQVDFQNNTISPKDSNNETDLYSESDAWSLDMSDRIIQEEP